MPGVGDDSFAAEGIRRILTVCLGNICRSPTAEAAILAAAKQHGLPLTVDSAGTSGYHVGEPPDRRMVAAARGAGLRLRGLGRRVTTDDFADFDLILPMDAANERRLLAMEPPGSVAMITRFRRFDPMAGAELDIPDPYFGGVAGFAAVVEMCRRAAGGLVEALANGET